MHYKQRFFNIHKSEKAVGLTKKNLWLFVRNNELNYIKLGHSLVFIPLDEINALKHIYSLKKHYKKQDKIKALNQYYLEKGLEMDYIKDLPELLGTKDLCQLFGIAPVTIHRRIINGELKAYKLGSSRRNYFKRDEVMALIQARKVQE
ncbi:helix-turn-helix domain-containing protein [Campylobacter sp. 2018MI13]|uniref:helix-turn-helix transcriptional regulator n=1 Tax=Campylobacter sp. 2018MI13 TaxID=2836737 RepID=UPI001BDAD852|nr:helix-turn-helix domain-containing protein [Campylobacter sp. 2018MI13]MBT0883132.1 helix-turn-helix domain-containing protein [Campylobacter sp. 2018MI13]